MWIWYRNLVPLSKCGETQALLPTRQAQENVAVTSDRIAQPLSSTSEVGLSSLSEAGHA